MANENVAPNKAIASAVPSGIAGLDVGSGIVHDIGACNYTQIGTSGTTTVSAGPCVYYAALCYVLTTSTGAVTILDGTNTFVPTVTQTAVGATTGYPNITPLGIRCLTSLVVITTGTNANKWNILWD